MTPGALFTPDRRHRLTLWRIWDDTLPRLAVIGLNPSTADETQDDPTIRRCIAFARRDGFGGLMMFNLFAWRSTDPKALRDLSDDDLWLGGHNHDHIVDSVVEIVSQGGDVLCAWGNHGAYRGAGDALVARLVSEGVQPKCFRKTKAGQPEHPLYMPGDQPFVGMCP